VLKAQGVRSARDRVSAARDELRVIKLHTVEAPFVISQLLSAGNACRAVAGLLARRRPRQVV
jgi:hypothetical protein